MASQIVDEAGARPAISPTSRQARAALTEALGEHPEDFLGTMDSAAATLDELAALFEAIKALAASDGPMIPSARLRAAGRLASLGSYVADDACNRTGNTLFEARKSLVSAGVLSAKVEGA